MKLVAAALTLGVAMVTLLPPKVLSAGLSAPILSLNRSPDLQQLFQAETRELLLGTQRIAGALPIANWDGIADSAMAMRNRYVLENTHDDSAARPR